jgi:Protein of unknown function (DUF2788)
VHPGLAQGRDQIAPSDLTFGAGGCMRCRLFVILQLARESRAGRFGTFVLLIGLGSGMPAFAAEGLIESFLAGVA